MPKITPTTNDNPALADVTPPPGAVSATAWQLDMRQPYRVVFGSDHTVTDHTVEVYTTAIQFPDGSLDDGSEVEPPQVWIYRADDNPSSSDQARELARAIMAAAEELDGLTDGTGSP